MNKLFELIRRRTKTEPDFESCKYCESKNDADVPDWGCFDPKIFKYIVVFVKKGFRLGSETGSCWQISMA